MLIADHDVLPPPWCPYLRWRQVRAVCRDRHVSALLRTITTRKKLQTLFQSRIAEVYLVLSVVWTSMLNLTMPTCVTTEVALHHQVYKVH